MNKDRIAGAVKAPVGDAIVGGINATLQALADHVRQADRPPPAPQARPAPAAIGAGPLPINAAMQLAQTSMRSEIGKLHLDQALSSRQMLNAAVAAAVEEAAVNWGSRSSATR
jgi:hypothetical protein